MTGSRESSDFMNLTQVLLILRVGQVILHHLRGGGAVGAVRHGLHEEGDGAAALEEVVRQRELAQQVGQVCHGRFEHGERLLRGGRGGGGGSGVGALARAEVAVDGALQFGEEKVENCAAALEEEDMNRFASQ